MLNTKGIYGNISIKTIKNSIFLDGNISYNDDSQYEEFLKSLYEKHPGKIVFNNLKVNKLEIIESNEEFNTNNEVDTENKLLDEVEILYIGMMDLSHIIPNNQYKDINFTGKLKVDNVIKVLGAFSPLVLDKNLKVIDGNMRLQLAIENNYKELPVVVYNCEGKKADTLRLLMNRSSEFPKWKYSEIDDFVDNTPQIQPLAEPLGFFGTNILPTSYFANTVVEYVIDPFNEKQKCYRQEDGLAEWAEYRRKQMKEQLEQKYAKKKLKKFDENTVSLFSLMPGQSDFLEKEDPVEFAEEITQKWEQKAEEITNTLDEKKKQELEENGGVWQNSHRTSKQMAKDAKENFIEKIENSDELSSLEKSHILDNLDKYANMSIKEIKEELDENER